MGGSLTDDEIKFVLQNTPFIVETAIETGTYKGESTRKLSKFFKTVYTIEIQQTLYNEAKNNNKDISNIKYYLGDSTDILSNIVKEIKTPALYFIDAHISGTDSGWNKKELVPLITELKSILSNNKNNGIFIIDDLRLFNKYDDWKGITENTIRDVFLSFKRNIIKEFTLDDRYYIIV